ncbi:hypothetical protein EVAR_95426_1 [Eumeta japonica]|uniref:Uncharacterized protein n=1 Tax=Eumeta variegata TaxID=151549 RepID=A0A4C1VKY0_EUMVA|nr:hypothetical protein EVAR_95426_1 [Eumeta japonica]
MREIKVYGMSEIEIDSDKVRVYEKSTPERYPFFTKRQCGGGREYTVFQKNVSEYFSPSTAPKSGLRWPGGEVRTGRTASGLCSWGC